MNLTDWIELFRAGEQTDSAGNKKTWTKDDLDQIVASYNPAEHEAPVVIGHPEADAPAYGWVAALKREGDVLLAQFKDLYPPFVDMLKQGLFKKRSIALYPGLKLRHVGWLGAMPPAVKGLKNAAFMAGAFSEFSTEQSDSIQPKEDSMEKNVFMEWLKEGLALGLVKSPAAAADEKKAAEFAERETALAAREVKSKADEAASATARATAAKAIKAQEIHAFCEGLKGKGQLLPAWQAMGLEKFLGELPSETEYAFAEGSDTKKETPLAFMRRFLAELPKTIEFKEKTGDDDGTKKTMDAKTWAATEFKKHEAVYQTLNVTAAMLEPLAPAAK